jgi:hypothetical protein
MKTLHTYRRVTLFGTGFVFLMIFSTETEILLFAWIGLEDRWVGFLYIGKG